MVLSPEPHFESFDVYIPSTSSRRDLLNYTLSGSSVSWSFTETPRGHTDPSMDEIGFLLFSQNGPESKDPGVSSVRNLSVKNKRKVEHPSRNFQTIH